MIGMDTQEIEILLNEIVTERGVPKNIKSLLEDSIGMLSSDGEMDEKVAHITSILDDASNDPNLSAHIRTKIWSAVSCLESGMR